MSKSTPVIFIMFAVVLLALSIVGISSYYGEADWTWIAEQVASFTLIIIVLGVAFYTLFGWLKR